jgi:hypothetical protein
MRTKECSVIAVFLAVLGAIHAERYAQGQENYRPVVRELIQGLATAECPVRWRALSDFLQGGPGGGGQLDALRDLARAADPQMEARLRPIIEFLTREENTRRTTDARVDTLQQIASFPDKADRGAALEDMRREMWGVIPDLLTWVP